MEKNQVLSYKSLFKYLTKIIKSTPLLIKFYLSNKIYLEIVCDDSSKLFNIDFLKGNIKENVVFPKSSKDVKIIVNSYVLNDVFRKSNWNSLGVSKRLVICSNLSNMRFTVFNIVCRTIECGGFLPLSNLLNFRCLSIWKSRYREIIDLIKYALKLFFYKCFGFKFFI